MHRFTILLASLALGGTLACAGPTEDALRVGEEAFAKKEYASALTTWVNAYNERATADTANDETCAKLLMNAASLMAQTGRSKESAVCYENLLKLRQKLNGAESIEANKIKSLLAAQISNAGGDIDSAERLARESAAALEKAGDEHFDDRLLALTNLAGILFMKKDRLGAHDVYAQVVALSDKRPTKALNLVVEAYKSMAAIADFFGRPKDNLQYLRKASELSRQHFGADSPATFLARIDVASALSAAGMNADAKSAFDGIISDLEKKAPPADDKLMHQRWAAATYRLAYVEAALANQDRVYELLKSSLVHAQAGWGDLDGNTLPIYLDLAKLHIARKNYEQGVKCYQKVLDIRRRELGPDHGSTRETQKILNELLDDVQRAKAGKR
jgi:tetratricopeptide (TPR) repeat protein